MNTLKEVLVLFVAAEHVAFLVLEMFFWTKPLGRRVFGMSEELAKASAPLAMNQGLYNGFLAAGLLWGCVFGGGTSVIVFFLSCVVVAGVFGAATAKRSILFVQGLPAAIALVVVYFAQ
jgi:putative membrane protein